MVEVEICREPEERDDWHARWLTMQSAYAEYKRSSEVLECTHQTADDPAIADQVRLAMLEGRQRLAFERYVDARIAFLESRFDEMNRPDSGGSAAAGTPADGAGRQEQSRIKAWLSTVSSGPALQTLAVVLLCTMSFSLAREYTLIRNLETARDALRVALFQTGREVQRLEQRLDASSPTPPPAPQHTQRASAPPEAPAKRSARKTPPEHGAAQLPSARQADATGRAPSSAGANKRVEGRAIYAFSLSPSREFKRVGPLSVLLKSIDTRKGSASVSIVTDATQVEVQHLRVNQPVWFNMARSDHPLGLVADRIMTNRVEGHLLEGESGKHDVRASRTETTP